MNSKFRTKRLNEIKSDFSDENFVMIADNANFFGQKSRGHSQSRGNGALALSENLLIFYMWKPRRKLIIPRDHIQSTESVDGFFEKIKGGRPLLKITFMDKYGKQDEAAWWTPHLHKWLAALQKRS